MDAGALSLIGVLIALVILVIGSYRGTPLLVLGPLAALVVIVFSKMPIIETLKGAYAESFAGFAQKNFLLFLPATVLGAMIGDSGAAQDVANTIHRLTSKSKGANAKFWVLMGLSAITAILSLGGVSGFVVIFTIAPICYSIFKEMDIPWHYVIAVAVYGGSMWTAIFPGSPSVQNLMPIEYLGTSATSAPVLGIIASVIMIVVGFLYIWFMLKRSERLNEGFSLTGSEMEKNSANLNMEGMKKQTTTLDFIKALTPSVVLLVALNVFKIEPFVSLTIGCLVCLVLYWNKFDNVLKTLGNGANSTMKSIMNVAAVVGFGGVVGLTDGFQYLVANLDKIPGPPLVQLALATNIIAGITGSASGGEGIALKTLAPTYLAAGVSPDLIHRVLAVSCYGLDSLPHNGSAINRLNYTHLTHRQGYYHEFWLGAMFPFINSIVIALLATAGIV